MEEQVKTELLWAIDAERGLLIDAIVGVEMRRRFMSEDNAVRLTRRLRSGNPLSARRLLESGGLGRLRPIESGGAPISRGSLAAAVQEPVAAWVRLEQLFPLSDGGTSLSAMREQELEVGSTRLDGLMLNGEGAGLTSPQKVDAAKSIEWWSIEREVELAKLKRDVLAVDGPTADVGRVQALIARVDAGIEEMGPVKGLESLYRETRQKVVKDVGALYENPTAGKLSFLEKVESVGFQRATRAVVEDGERGKLLGGPDIVHRAEAIARPANWADAEALRIKLGVVDRSLGQRRKLDVLDAVVCDYSRGVAGHAEKAPVAWRTYMKKAVVRFEGVRMHRLSVEASRASCLLASGSCGKALGRSQRRLASLSKGLKGCSLSRYLLPGKVFFVTAVLKQVSRQMPA